VAPHSQPSRFARSSLLTSNVTTENMDEPPDFSDDENEGNQNVTAKDKGKLDESSSSASLSSFEASSTLQTVAATADKDNENKKWELSDDGKSIIKKCGDVTMKMPVPPNFPTDGTSLTEEEIEKNKKDEASENYVPPIERNVYPAHVCNVKGSIIYYAGTSGQKITRIVGLSDEKRRLAIDLWEDEYFSDDDDDDNAESEVQESPFKGKGHRLNDDSSKVSHPKTGIIDTDTIKPIKQLALRCNLITKIRGIKGLTSLLHLELYDNQVAEIRGLETLVNLRILDLTHNKINRIRGLKTLRKLEKLYLASNKITTVPEESLDNLVSLEVLDLGDNQITSMKGLATLGRKREAFIDTDDKTAVESDSKESYTEQEKKKVIKGEDASLMEENSTLRELWLGKNKIKRLDVDVMRRFTHLTHLDIQCNRLTSMENIKVTGSALTLKELYLGFNGITKIEGLGQLKCLETLDISRNKLTGFDDQLSLENLSHSVTDLWLHANKIEDMNEIKKLASLSALRTVYLEHNPIQKEWEYRKFIKTACPQLTQLDAHPC